MAAYDAKLAYDAANIVHAPKIVANIIGYLGSGIIPILIHAMAAKKPFFGTIYGKNICSQKWVLMRSRLEK